MPVRDFLVVVDSVPAVEQCLAPVAALAAAQGARLTGLYAAARPADTAYGDISGWMQFVESYLETQRTAAGLAEAAFRQQLGQHKLEGDWIYRESDPTETALALSALYDLVVVGQPGPDAASGSGVAMRPEGVVLGAGRPVLVVPYAGRFATVGERVLVAWNRSREAARALYDALFVLDRATTVTILEIDPGGRETAVAGASAAEVANALSRRGIRASAQTVSGGDVGVGDLLLSQASDYGADLLVMGAYGRSRLREYVLGGASRAIFQHMTLPVLMAH